MVTSGVTASTNLDIPVIHLDAFDPTQYLTVVAIGSPYSRRAVVEQLPSNTEYGTLIHQITPVPGSSLCCKRLHLPLLY